MSRAAAFLLAACVMILPGCINTSDPERIKEPPATKSPKAAFEFFTEALRKSDLEQFYGLLSRDTRFRYGLWEFQFMFNKTRFGKLFRHLMLEWKVDKYEIQPDQTTAVVTLRHPTDKTASKRFEMVLEKMDWKVRLTLAQALDMPEFDERFLFPEAFMAPEGLTEGETQIGYGDRTGGAAPEEGDAGVGAEKDSASGGGGRGAGDRPGERRQRRPDRR